MNTNERYFIITNPNGNDAGEYSWIFAHNPLRNVIKGDMIQVYEEFERRGGDAFVSLSDLTEITKQDYEAISELINEGEDTSELIQSVLNKYTKLHVLQADIIYKALYYTANNEGLEIPSELTETFKILAEHNPYDTHVEHTVEVMEFLNEFIRNSSNYSEYFLEEDEDEK